MRMILKCKEDHDTQSNYKEERLKVWVDNMKKMQVGNPNERREYYVEGVRKY